MRADRPSFTAAAVAVCRTLGRVLPEDARIAEDPYGVDFGTPGLRAAAGAALRFPTVAESALPHVRPLHSLVLWMQVRTRFLDDELLRFVSAGGRQVLLLGAGFDARAARFANALGEVTVFEVDHPATQAQKRGVLSRRGAPSARVVYVPWDFENRPLGELPDHLASLGHDRAAPTLTIWEGVTMYLTDRALDASVAAVAALSAEGSPFAMTYMTPDTLRRMRTMLPFLRRSEPFRRGWERGAIGGWLAERGFSLREDHGSAALGNRYLPARYAPLFGEGRRVAVAVRGLSPSNPP